MTVTTPDTAVPEEESPERCPHCGRPFATERLRDLHVGERHRDECSEDELAAHEAARDTESDDLFVYHMKVVAAVVLLFFAFTYAYTFVWAG